MAMRARIRSVVLLLVWMPAFHATASSDSPHTNPRGEPGRQELESAFLAQGRQAWSFSPASPESIRRLQAEVPWDMRRVEAIQVTARIRQRQHHALRLRWIVNSRLGAYAADQSTPIPIIGTQALVLADLAVSSGMLIPIGHQRPWDALAAAEVTSLELRAEVSGSSQPLTVELTSPSLKTGPPSGVIAAEYQLLDLHLESAPADVEAEATLVFRLNPLPDDPFAPDGDGDVCVRLPDGREVLAFLDQPQMVKQDGWARRHVAVGPPVYRAYLPSRPEKGSLYIHCGGQGWEVHAAQVPRSPAPSQVPDDHDSLSQTRWQPELEIPFPPPGDPFAQGLWSGAPEAWVFEGRTWKVAQSLNAKAAWRPVTFWNERWACFAGSSRPDFEVALRMDKRLAEAHQAGEVRPMVLLDGENFMRHGTFTWLSHPLYVENGGLLYGPGEMLRTPEGFEFCRRLARYALARWGRSRSVSSFVLTAQPSTPGVAEFHNRFAESIRSWLDSSRRPLYSLHPFACEPRTVKTVEGIASAPEPVGGAWRWGLPRPERITLLLEGSGADASAMLELVAAERQMSVCAIKPYRFAAVPFDQPSPDDFFEADALIFDVWVPADAPADMRAGVHLRDRDGLWFQALLPGLLNPGDWTTCMVDLTGRNAQGLKGIDHRKDWTDYSRIRLMEIGLHVFSTHKESRLQVRFANVRGVIFERQGAPEPRRIEWLDQPAHQVQRGDLWEAHLKLDRAYDNPFDPCQVDLTALIKTPSGKTVRLPAFLDQPCERREEKPGGTECVEPVGAERWTVRYRVLEEGPHQVTFQLREGGTYKRTSARMAPDYRFSPNGIPYQPALRDRDSWVFRYEQQSADGKRLVENVAFEPGPVVATLSVKNAFTSTPATPSWHGFLRADADQRHFRFDDGTFYYALGPCLRSPSDNRLPYLDAKWSPERIDQIGKRGTYQFDEYLDAFQKSGINWARVWACSWWCGLQWRRDWQGYQGLGRYNLCNAWQLDHVLNEAERRGIYISLCLTNHGQVSRLIDTEWKNNPYNKLLGGPLASASEFFTRAEPQIGHMNLLRYMAARYGHSPAILTWDLFSELEYTEEYRPFVRWPRPDAAPYNIDQWHQKMARFLKQVDVNQHMVASHYSRPIRGYHTLALPELDVAASNAYSAFEELGGGRMDASQALADFWMGNDYQQGAMRGYRVLNKPVLVEEQGRHWMGAESEDGEPHPHNTKQQLDADLHASLWGSVVQPLAGATGYWWWLHLHFDNRYGEYRALANFIQDEDFRARPSEQLLEPHLLPVENDNQLLRARARMSDQRAYLWVYHKQVPLRVGSFPAVSQARVSLPALKGGMYRIEYWDTHKGERTSTATLTHAGGPLVLSLPTIQGDLAIKIKPAEK